MVVARRTSHGGAGARVKLMASVLEGRPHSYTSNTESSLSNLIAEKDLRMHSVGLKLGLAMPDLGFFRASSV